MKGKAAVGSASFILAMGALTLSVWAGSEDDSSFLTAGVFTVSRFDAQAYLQPVPGLPLRQLQMFERGRHHFDKKWAAISSLQFEWGLGPTFIAKSCLECHAAGGRGSPPASSDEQLVSVLVRLSIPGEDEHGGPKPDPSYGDQIQNFALRGPFPDFAYHTAPVPPEAELYLDWEEKVVEFADGERVALRKPMLRIEKLAFGPLGAGSMTSVRIAQPVFGLGLLEAVPEETILAGAQRQRLLGFNGRPNYVWDAIGKRTTLGRFGWKANQPSIKQQIATAALGDMGLTSPLYREQNCPPIQQLCSMQTPGNDPELVTTDWVELEFWTLGLGVPARRNVADPRVQRGAAMFEQARCAVCHVPEMKTGEQFMLLPPLANQTFHAYTDLLLHDMGEELADNRPDFRAGGRDWRTQPLWGIGLSGTVNGSTALMHDGRARNVTEAILWHGGEAAVSRGAFLKMSKEDREVLLRFLDSI